MNNLTVKDMLIILFRLGCRADMLHRHKYKNICSIQACVVNLKRQKTEQISLTVMDTVLSEL